MGTDTARIQSLTELQLARRDGPGVTGDFSHLCFHHRGRLCAHLGMAMNDKIAASSLNFCSAAFELICIAG